MTTPGGWVVELFVDAAGSCPYERFIDRVDDTTFAAVDAAVEHVLTRHGLELCKTEWMKALGEGLYEFRIRHDATEIAERFGQEPSTPGTRPASILVRVFCHFYGDRVVLLLSGYDKGRDPSSKRQDKEIALARKHLTAWKEERKRHKARDKR
jgi:hypothetical protein